MGTDATLYHPSLPGGSLPGPVGSPPRVQGEAIPRAVLLDFVREAHGRAREVLERSRREQFPNAADLRDLARAVHWLSRAVEQLLPRPGGE